MQSVASKEIHSKDVTGIDSEEELLNRDDNLKLRAFRRGGDDDDGWRWTEPEKSAMVRPGSVKDFFIITCKY